MQRGTQPASLCRMEHLINLGRLDFDLRAIFGDLFPFIFVAPNSRYVLGTTALPLSDHHMGNIDSELRVTTHQFQKKNTIKISCDNHNVHVRSRLGQEVRKSGSVNPVKHLWYKSFICSRLSLLFRLPSPPLLSLPPSQHGRGSSTTFP